MPTIENLGKRKLIKKKKKKNPHKSHQTGRTIFAIFGLFPFSLHFQVLREVRVYYTHV